MGEERKCDKGIEVFAPWTFGSDAQKAFIIKQGDYGTPVSDICRKAGIGQVTYFSWQTNCADLLQTEMKRLKQFEAENARLKKIMADLTLDREMLQVRAV